MCALETMFQLRVLKKINGKGPPRMKSVPATGIVYIPMSACKWRTLIKKHDRAKVGNTIQKREETNMVNCWHGCGYETKMASPGLASVYTPHS
jgi:hypothetical protein